MTEYELLNAAQGQTSILLALGSVHISVLTAYLVVGHIAGHTLSRAMAVFVTILFAIWSIQNLMLTVRCLFVLLAVTTEMRAEAHAGNAFAWLQALSQDSGGASEVIAWAYCTVPAAADVAAVWFFFDFRRRNHPTKVTGTASTAASV